MTVFVEADSIAEKLVLSKIYLTGSWLISATEFKSDVWLDENRLDTNVSLKNVVKKRQKFISMLSARLVSTRRVTAKEIRERAVLVTPM